MSTGTKVRRHLPFLASAKTPIDQLQGAKIDAGGLNQPIILITSSGDVLFKGLRPIPPMEKQEIIARINHFVDAPTMASLTVQDGIRWEADFWCMAPGLFLLLISLALVNWYKTSYVFDKTTNTLAIETAFLYYRNVSQYPFREIEIEIDKTGGYGKVSPKYVLKLMAPGHSFQVHTYPSESEAEEMAHQIRAFIRRPGI